MNGYELELYDHGHEEELREVYSKSFGSEPPPGYFKWKYIDNPAGRAVAFVARYEGRIAAFYGVIPETYVINGKQEVVYQSMDTMTHPDHRGKGLFTKLALATFAHLRSVVGGIHLIGYPGPTSYSGFVNKLGWKSITELKYLFVYRSMFNVRSVFHGAADLSVSAIHAFGPEWDAYFSAREPSTRPIAKHIDGRVLSWRLLEHPANKYQCLSISSKDGPEGICAYRIDTEGRLFILLLDVKKRGMLETVTKQVLKHLFKDNSIGSVFTFNCSDSSVTAALGRSGFVSNPFSKGPFSYRTPYIVLADPRPDGLDPYDVDNYEIQPITRDY